MDTQARVKQNRMWRTRRKWLFLVAVMMLVGTVQGQECRSPTFDFSASIFSGGEISLTQVNDDIAEYEVENVRSVIVQPADTSPLHLAARLEGSKLIVSTTDSFRDYAQRESIPFLLAEMAFSCEVGSFKPIFRVNLKKENLFRPTFAQQEYEIVLPLPLPGHFDIEQFIDNGKGIVAHDYDFPSENAITFSLEENSYFYIEHSTGISEKEFKAIMKTTSTLTQLPAGLSLTITGTDAFNPPQSSTATLKFQGDPTVIYTRAPLFQESLYKSSYKRGDPFVAIETALLSDTYDDTVTYVLSGEDAGLFTISPKQDRSGASVTLNTGSVPESKAFASVIVTARRANTEPDGRTAIVVEIEPEVKLLPEFEETIYVGSVGADRSITIAGIKLEEESIGNDQVTLRLVGEDAEFFGFAKVDNTVSLLVNDKLTEEVLNDKFYFHFALEATKENVGTGVAFVVLDVTKDDVIVPRFDQLYYEGSVAEDGTTDIAVIPIPAEMIGLTFDLAGDTSLFSIAVQGNTITITGKDITEESLLGKSYLLVRINAKQDQTIVAETIVIVRVIRKDIITPTFQNNFQIGQLVEGTSVLIPIPIIITPETYTSETDVKIIDPTNLFDLRPTTTPNEFTIVLRNGAVLPLTESHYTVIVEASNTKSPVASCFVLIEVLRIPTPEFEQLIYEGLIDSSVQLEELKLKLKPETYSDAISFTLLGQDAEHFQVAKLPTNEAQITLKNTVTEEDIANRNNLRLEVRASRSGTSLTATVPVVVFVQKAEVKLPKFEKPLYKSTIDTDLQLAPFEKIQLVEGTFAEGLEVNLMLNNSDLFAVVLSNEGQLTISLKEALTSADVEDLDRFEFVVEVTNTGVGSAFTTIVIDVEREPVVTPEFTAASYAGTVQEGSRDLNFLEKIILVDETITADVRYEILGEDRDFVDYAINQDRSIKLSLKETVTIDQLKDKSQLNFVIHASNPGSVAAAASIVVRIIRPIRAIFTKSSFSGLLREGNGKVNFDSDKILLVEDTFLESTIFGLTGSDSNLFEVTVGEGKEIQISLRSNTNWNQIRFHNFVSFLLEATNPGALPTATTIIISIENQDVPTPKFTKPFYRGTLQKGFREVTFAATDVITIERDTITPTLEYRVVENDHDLFDVTPQDNKFVVSLKQSVEDSTIENRDLFSFMIEANNQYGDMDSTAILISVRLEDIITPIFSGAIYSGAIHERTTQLELPEIAFQPGSAKGSIEVGADQGDSDWFAVQIVESKVVVTVRSETAIPWDSIVDRGYLSFRIQATNPGSEAATAFVVLAIRAVVTPRFEKQIYNGAIGTDLRLTLNDRIFVTEATYSELVTLEIVDSNSDLLRVVKQDREAVIELTRQITGEDLKDVKSLQITLQAKVREDSASNCFLQIELPLDEGGSCTETPPIFECTECYDCSTDLPLDDVPVFAYGNYRFFLQSDQTGMVGLVRASTKDPTATVEHRAVIDDIYLRSKISLSSAGVLTISDSLLPNEYKFRVIARNTVAGKQATADVLLDVAEEAVCDDGPWLPTVVRSLVIGDLEEETTHVHVFPSRLSECEYEFVDQKPYMDRNYFRIDPETQFLVADPFDREDTELFAGMPIPQFQLRLRLICPESSNDGTRIVKRALIETDDLIYSRLVTTINIIVTDINDNDPSFVHPEAGQEYHLAFPDSVIAASLMVPELITVAAVDKDEGLNAKIKYSLEENADFGVDPESGVVYPLKNAMKVDPLIRLTVKATDRDGAEDGRTSAVQLAVHRLEEGNLVTMTITGTMDVSNLIKQINTNEIRLQVLMHARVPMDGDSEDTRLARQAPEEDSVQRVIVYGFNSGFELQDSDTIIGLIRSSSLSASISSESYRRSCTAEPTCDDSALVGLIVAASVLGSLFLISAGLAIFLYVKYVRGSTSTAPTNPSDMVQLENDFEISPPPSPPMLGSPKKIDDSLVLDNDRKLSIQITGITEQESEDSRVSSERLAHSLDNRLELVDEYGSVSSKITLEDTSSTEPKNVKFNELVERIEVVEHLPADDADSIYSIRM